MNKEIVPVLDKISATLKEHNMVGIFMVGNGTHIDWRMEIAAPWSCAWIEPVEGGKFKLRIRSKREEYPSKEAQHEAIEKTTGTLVTFGHNITKLNEQIDTVLTTISKHGVEIKGKSYEEN